MQLCVLTPGSAPRQQFVALFRKRANQSVRPPRFQDRSKLSSAIRQLADRAVEIDIDDLPIGAGLAHEVVERDSATIGLDNLRLDDLVAVGTIDRLQNLELLARKAVETTGISGDRHSRERVGDADLLLWRQRAPA